MAAPVPGDLYPLIAAFLDKQGCAAAAAAVRADAKKKGVQVKPTDADLFAIYKAHAQQHGGCVYPGSGTAASAAFRHRCATADAATPLRAA